MQDGDPSTAKTPHHAARHRQRRGSVALRLHRQQHEQRDAAEQVRGDDRRINFIVTVRAPNAPWMQTHASVAVAHHGDTSCTVPRRPAPVGPARQRQHGDQHADPGGQVAMDHLDQALPRVTGPSGSCASAARISWCAPRGWRCRSSQPVRAAQPRIGEPGERAEQHQVEGQEERGSVSARNRTAGSAPRWHSQIQASGPAASTTPASADAGDRGSGAAGGDCIGTRGRYLSGPAGPTTRTRAAGDRGRAELGRIGIGRNPHHPFAHRIDEVGWRSRA